jgi:hypothetical protein
MELNQHGLAGELDSAIILRQLTSKPPAIELKRWLLEKPDQASCAREFFLFVEKREAITAKVMAQTPRTAKVQESTKMKDSQDPKKIKAVSEYIYVQVHLHVHSAAMTCKYSYKCTGISS